jgi:hypothetical protein
LENGFHGANYSRLFIETGNKNGDRHVFNGFFDSL